VIDRRIRRIAIIVWAELFEAVCKRIPIVCIAVKDAGYDFDEARAFLSSLQADLAASDPAALEELRTQLATRSRTLAELQAALHARIPMIISMQFDPEGSDNHLTAVVQDSLSRIARERDREAGSVSTSVPAVGRASGSPLRRLRPRGVGRESSFGLTTVSAEISLGVSVTPWVGEGGARSSREDAPSERAEGAPSATSPDANASALTGTTVGETSTRAAL